MIHKDVYLAVHVKMSQNHPDNAFYKLKPFTKPTGELRYSFTPFGHKRLCQAFKAFGVNGYFTNCS